MLKQTIQFTDYNDQPREVTEYFHLSESEIIDLQARSPEGFEKEMDAAVKSNDAAKVLDFIRDLVHRSYGRKTADGIHFRKSPEILQEFIDSAYYSDFILGLIEDDGRRGVEFVQGIMPKKLLERALQQVRGESVEPTVSHYAPSARERFDAAVSEAKVVGVTPQADVGTFGGVPQPIKNAVVETNQPLMTPEEMQQFLAWRGEQKIAENPEAGRTQDFRVPVEGE